jgi:3-oxoacyl-[acyl-carrier-protein] synthase II
LKRRVVITGIGAVTPIGLNVDEYWQALIAGKNGIGPITLFDSTVYPVKIAAEVKGFDPEKYLPLKRVDRTSRVTQLGMVASRMAVESAKLDLAAENPADIGVLIATSGMLSMVADYGEIIKTKPNRLDPLIITKIAPSMVPAQIGLDLKLRGPNTSLSSACASGSDALGTALSHIQLGHCEVMVAGGSEAGVNNVALATTARVGALTRNPDFSQACRPYDLNRSGFVLGEGAGILILESLEHAVKRGAPILAELAGAGWSFDAFNDTAPDAEQEAVAMSKAIKDAGLTAEQIDYINAHGTSTVLNDVTETKAIKLVLGQRAYQVPISSNKSMIGHLAAAAGAVEAVAAVKTIMHGIIPPTINYKVPDPACDLDYVPNQARAGKVDVCLSNSFGMGGQNCCLIFKKFNYM